MCPLPPVELPIGRMFSYLGKEYLHILRTRLRHLDIDRNYYALILIDSYQGEITQQELAVLLDSDKVSVVRVVDYLSEKGYVKRLRKASDKRKHNLVLTDKARAAIPEIKDSIRQTNIKALRGLTPDQASELLKLMTIIKQNITENNTSL